MRSNGSSMRESDSEEFLVRILSAYTPHQIVGALSATFETSGLGQLATELDKLVRYLKRPAKRSAA